MSQISFEVVKIHIEVHLQTFHRQRTRGRMARRCQIWDRSNFPNAAASVKKMGNLLFNPFFSHRVWSVAWQWLFYVPFSGDHSDVMRKHCLVSFYENTIKQPKWQRSQALSALSKAFAFRSYHNLIKLKLEQTSASKSRLNFSLKVLNKLQLRYLKKVQFEKPRPNFSLKILCKI